MTTTAQRYQRIRTLALSAGMVIGMVAAAVGPQLAHAAPTKAAAKKSTVTEKMMALPEATAEQLQAAERVLTGSYDCEFGKRVSVDRNERNNGYFNLHLGNQAWTMKPVLSSTGAVRLEDVKGTAMLLQILTKSMLMDVKGGRRMVDGCVHAAQREAEAALAKEPRQPLFERPAGAQ
jgi:hypothetical protein